MREYKKTETVIGVIRRTTKITEKRGFWAMLLGKSDDAGFKERSLKPRKKKREYNW